jgi:hypothetical protein
MHLIRQRDATKDPLCFYHKVVRSKSGSRGVHWRVTAKSRMCAALDAAPKEPRASFHAAQMAIMDANSEVDLRKGLLGKEMVNKQRMDTVAFSIGGALFHAVALSCEQNSPIMKSKLSKISNIYKQVIPMRNVGNLDSTSMYEARFCGVRLNCSEVGKTLYISIFDSKNKIIGI